MDQSTKTRPSLVIRLRDGRDHEAWTEFVRLYSPLVYRFARRRGLQQADAADLAQDVFQSVAASIGRFDYDPDRGSFRGWLKTLARCRLHDMLVRLERQAKASGDTRVHELIQQCFSSEEDDPSWDEDYQRYLFDRAATRVRVQFRDNTWRAFRRTVVDGAAPEEVAGELGMSVGAVYIARSRVTARLRREIRRIEDEV